MYKSTLKTLLCRQIGTEKNKLWSKIFGYKITLKKFGKYLIKQYRRMLQFENQQGPYLIS